MSVKGKKVGFVVLKEAQHGDQHLRLGGAVAEVTLRRPPPLSPHDAQVLLE